MNTTKRLAARIAASIAVIGAVAAIGASPAAAVLGTFSHTGTAVGTGAITWSLEGQPGSVTCPPMIFTGNMSGAGWSVQSNYTYCNGWGPNAPRLAIAGHTDGAGSRWIEASAPFGVMTTAYGHIYVAPQIVGNWVNGNASTPSRIVLNNALMGTIKDGPYARVRASGTINVTTTTGGLITLN